MPGFLLTVKVKPSKKGKIQYSTEERAFAFIVYSQFVFFF